MARWIGLGLLAAAVAVLAARAMMAGGDAVWEDPSSVAAPEKPNWALAAPPGVATATAPTLPSPVWRSDSGAVLAALIEIARAEPRVSAQEAPSEAAGALFVQRSRIFGFPDHVSARAVDLDATDGGPRASLLIYGRSVVGYSDLGVNRSRVARWLAALDARFERAE